MSTELKRPTWDDILPKGADQQVIFPNPAMVHGDHNPVPATTGTSTIDSSRMPKAAGKKTVIGNFADALKLAERDIKGENAHKPVTLEELRKREARDVNLRIVGDKLIIEHTEDALPKHPYESESTEGKPVTEEIVSQFLKRHRAACAKTIAWVKAEEAHRAASEKMLEKACLSDFEDESSSNDDDDYDDLLRDSPVLKGVNAKIRKKIADKIEQGEVSSFAPGQKFAEEMITAVVKEAHEEQKKERQRKHAVLTPPPPLPPPPPPPTWPPPPLPLEMDTSAVRGVLSTSKDLAAVADDEMKKVPEEVRDRAMREREKHAALIKRVDDAYEKFRKAIHGENLPKLPGPKGFPSFHACRDGLLASIDREPEPLEDVLSRMEGVEKALPKIVISDCGTPEPSQTDETMPEPMGHRRTPEGVKVMEAKRRLNRSHMERVSQAHEKFHDALLDSDGPDAGVDYNDDCFLRQ